MAHEPADDPRAELQDSLEALERAQRELEAEVERRKAQLDSLAPGPRPAEEFAAAVARMMADMDAAVAEIRAHLATLRADLERQAKGE
jgi:hypothetical protein